MLIECSVWLNALDRSTFITSRVKIHLALTSCLLICWLLNSLDCSLWPLYGCCILGLPITLIDLSVKNIPGFSALLTANCTLMYNFGWAFSVHFQDRSSILGGTWIRAIVEIICMKASRVVPWSHKTWETAINLGSIQEFGQRAQLGLYKKSQCFKQNLLTQFCAKLASIHGKSLASTTYQNQVLLQPHHVPHALHVLSKMRVIRSQWDLIYNLKAGWQGVTLLPPNIKITPCVQFAQTVGSKLNSAGKLIFVKKSICCQKMEINWGKCILVNTSFSLCAASAN